MNIKFTKMHGLGNDFIVIDALHQRIDLTPSQIAELARRDIGIGFDQCLLLEQSLQVGIDFFYRIFNADGHEVGQCGNGARCLARFIQYHGLSAKKNIRVATRSTELGLEVNFDNSVTVDMGRPQLLPAEIPLLRTTQAESYDLSLRACIHENFSDSSSICTIHALSIGNPHALMVVADLNTGIVEELGARISTHPDFPEHCNAGFMQIINPHEILLRVHERGCGETLACGSGAVAAAAIGRLYHGLEAQIKVRMRGGELIVAWPDLASSIFVRGSADFVYEGVLL